MKDNFVLDHVGADFEDGMRLVRSPLKESQRDWWETQLHRMRQGQLSPDVFKYKLARGYTGENVPFLREHMTRSDFPLLLLSDTADRALLAGYAEEAHTWSLYTKMKINRDTNPSYLMTLDGSEGTLDTVPELGPYPEGSFTEAEYLIRARKYGKKFGFSLELFMNDGLNAFDSVPFKFGRSVRRTEDKIATAQYATDAAKATLFSAGNANTVTVANGASLNNPVFGIEGIQSALTFMASKRDADGNPIPIQGAYVVYPQELEMQAAQLRGALLFRGIMAVGSSSYEIETANYLNGMVTLVPNSRLSLDSETNPLTGWYIFANPNMGRPAIAAAKIMGRENPDILMKASNSVSLSGGETGPMDGDFDTDSIQYKVRMFMGGAQVDYRAVVFSKGTAGA